MQKVLCLLVVLALASQSTAQFLGGLGYGGYGGLGGYGRLGGYGGFGMGYGMGGYYGLGGLGHLGYYNVGTPVAYGIGLVPDPFALGFGRGIGGKGSYY